MGVRLGGWRRIMPFLFSLPPLRHELCGSAKYVAMPGSSRSSACRLQPRADDAVGPHAPKRLPSSCPYGHSQIDVRNGTRPRLARPPGLVGVCPPADGLRAAARHGAAGMLHGEAPAHQRRRPAPARPLRDPRCVLSNFCGPFRRFF